MSRSRIPSGQNLGNPIFKLLRTRSTSFRSQYTQIFLELPSGARSISRDSLARTITMADQHEHVINWDEAMQQVGEDEDFLRELLNDLRGELESQLAAIAAIIQVRV